MCRLILCETKAFEAADADKGKQQQVVNIDKIAQRCHDHGDTEDSDVLILLHVIYGLAEASFFLPKIILNNTGAVVTTISPITILSILCFTNVLWPSR